MKYEGFDIAGKLPEQAETVTRLKCRTCDTIFEYDPIQKVNVVPILFDGVGPFPDCPPLCPGCGRAGEVQEPKIVEPPVEYRDKIVRAAAALGVANAAEVVAESLAFIGEYVRDGHPWIAATLGIIWDRRRESMHLRLNPETITENGERRESFVRTHAATAAGYREWAYDLMRARESVALTFMGRPAPADQTAPSRAELFHAKAIIGGRRLLISFFASDPHTGAQAVLDCLRHKAAAGDIIRIEHWKRPASEYLVVEVRPPTGDEPDNSPQVVTPSMIPPP